MRDLVERLGIRARGGFAIQRVLPGSPADKAGLRPNQVITEIDGRPLTDLRVLYGRLAQAGAGGMMSLKVHGDDGVNTVRVQLGVEPIYSYGIEVARMAGMPLRCPTNHCS